MNFRDFLKKGEETKKEDPPVDPTPPQDPPTDPVDPPADPKE